MNQSSRKSTDGNGFQSSKLFRKETFSLGGTTEEDKGALVLDSEGFAVYSNVKFLKLIGKISAETG